MRAVLIRGSACERNNSHNPGQHCKYCGSNCCNLKSAGEFGRWDGDYRTGKRYRDKPAGSGDCTVEP
jgi:hypothetical protein